MGKMKLILDGRAVKRVKRAYDGITRRMYEHRIYIVAAVFIASSAFFFAQFFTLHNWDMLVRIMNAGYLFHGGTYFENQRAIPESVVIGALSFLLGGYAVYGFILLSALLFFFSLKEFSKSFNVDYLLLILLAMNPFVLFYGIKNGSEMMMLSFLILFISCLKTRNPAAGVFFSLAFLSKYDALYFLPLFVFMLDFKTLRALKKLLISLGLAILTLVPYLIYNLLTYRNLVFTFASSFLQNGYSVAIGAAAIANKYLFYGPYELLVLVPLVLLFVSINRQKRAIAFKQRRNIALLLSASVIGSIIYYSASGLYSQDLGYFRFFMPVLLLLALLASLFLRKEDLIPLAAFSFVSFLIAVMMLYSFMPAAYSEQHDSLVGISAFKGLYGTTMCTVQSNDWVYLDYYGLSATYIRNSSFYMYPIVSFGPVNTSLPLLSRTGGVYIYGSHSCAYTPPIDFPNGVNYDIALSRQNDSIACYWLFDTHVRFTPGLDACIALNDAFAGI